MKGIVFTPIMNAARRAGTKSMTRRIKSLGGKPPYKVGEVLYVRERHKCRNWFSKNGDWMAEVVYADQTIAEVPITDADLDKIIDRKRPGSWLPGRYMLASFARDHVRVTAIRSERLRAITSADARAEGVEGIHTVFPDGTEGTTYKNYFLYRGCPLWFKSAVASFTSLWESIHGEGATALNPEVWVIEFENCEKPSTI